MPIWSSEIKELEKLYESFRGQLPDLEKELERLVKADDENMILLYSRRCLEVIITDLCECELKRPRKTEPLKGIIDKLHKEGKVPSHIITSMHGLNELSTYGAHPKDFDQEQVKPVLINLDIIIKWYLKYKETGTDIKAKPSEEIRQEIKSTEDVKKNITISKKRLAGILGGLIGIIASVFAVLYFSNIIGGSKQSKEIEKSIAVLPFIDDSKNEENTSFINGLMDEIIINLQTIKDLRVPGRTSVEQYRNNVNKSIPEIAQELGVNYIVEGSGQKYGNTIVLRIQLLEGEKDKHLWGESYEQKINNIEDIIGIQSQIAQSIAEELKAIITPEEKQIIERTPTISLTAYDYYTRGKEEYIKSYTSHNNNIEALRKAEIYYHKALEYDSSFALAYAGLALVYIDKTYATNEYFSKNFLDSTIILADMALFYDDHLAEAYNARALYFLFNKNTDQALKEFEKALTYNPNYGEVYLQKAGLYLNDDYIKVIESELKAISLNRGKELPKCLSSLGDTYGVLAGFPDKAKKYYEEAFKLDGDTISYYSHLSVLKFFYGEDSTDFKKGMELLNNCYVRDSNNIGILYSLSRNYLLQRNYIESLKYIKKYIEELNSIGQIPLNRSHRVGYIYWKNGFEKESEHWFNEQIRICLAAIEQDRAYSVMDRAPYYDLAGVYAFRGNKEKAYENLKKFAEIPICSYNILYVLRNDELFDGIKNELEFQQIARDVEAKYQAEHERVKKWLEEQGML